MTRGGRMLDWENQRSLFTASVSGSAKRLRHRRIQGASVTHLSIEELVELILCRFVHSLDSVREVERVIVLRVQLAVELLKDAMHTVWEVLGATENAVALPRRTWLQAREHRIGCVHERGAHVAAGAAVR